jgi:hypothetical protein
VKKYLSDVLKKLSEWLYADGVPVVIDSGTKVWRVVEGPIYRYEFDDDFLIEAGIDEDYSCVLVVQIEEKGELGMANFWYETEEEALAIKSYFEVNIEPLEVT